MHFEIKINQIIENDQRYEVFLFSLMFTVLEK
jgi:hypothetical protein